MIYTANPFRLMFVIAFALTAALIAVGVALGWSGETLGTAFMGIIVIVGAIRALMVDEPAGRRQ